MEANDRPFQAVVDRLRDAGGTPIQVDSTITVVCGDVEVRAEIESNPEAWECPMISLQIYEKDGGVTDPVTLSPGDYRAALTFFNVLGDLLGVAEKQYATLAELAEVGDE